MADIVRCMVDSWCGPCCTLAATRPGPKSMPCAVKVTPAQPSPAQPSPGSHDGLDLAFPALYSLYTDYTMHYTLTIIMGGSAASKILPLLRSRQVTEW